MTSIYNRYSINNGYNIPYTTSFQGKVQNFLPKTSVVKDGYIANPLLENFGTKTEIETVAKTSPRIREILSEYKLPLKVNEYELEKLKTGHLQDTRIVASKIYSNLPSELKQEVNPQELQEAAMFHDYGKVLIPEKILNKNGELNDTEWAIMQQHSELGAELLKDKPLSSRAKDLVKFHHLDKGGNGYPAVNTGFSYGLDSEILSVADKYGALTEKRSYKDAMTREDALAILEKDVKEGLISQEVFNALKKSV
jgi:HD-GYP domain-containing protein (c-di-GMP phosphodiesterase class II)